MARKKKILPKQIAITPEGFKVMNGIFKLFDTSGFPLDIMLYLCIENKWMPSWLDFYDDALKVWSKKTIKNRLETAICDVYGIEFWTEVNFRLEKARNDCWND